MNKQIFTFFFLLVSLFGLNQAAKAQCQYAVSGPTSGATIEAGGTAIPTLNDDQVSGAIPIGFTFRFYGNSYTQLYISSNGFISFDPAAGNGCCDGQLIPDASSPNNLIAGFWEDLYPPGGGTITYQTIGSAPNRRMLVTFTNINHCCSGSNNPVTFQIKLYETTGIIAIHTGSCPSDGGVHTQGIENADGTSAITASGRNQANFSPSNDVVTFTPTTTIANPGAQNLNVIANTCAANYTIADPITNNCIGATWGYSTTGATTLNSSGNIIADGTGSGVLSFNKGATVVTLTCSAATSTTFTVTVTDNQAPTLASPGAQNLNVIANTCAANYTIADPITDNCTGATWGYSTTGATTLSSSGNTIADGTGSGALSFNKGATVVTLTGTDGTNAATSTTFTVTVTDNQAPTLANPGNQSLNVITNTCAANYTIADPITDNCTGATWGYSTTGATTLSSSGNTIADGTGSGVLSFNKGATVVTLTGTDGTNAATSTTFTVTVTDNQAPSITCSGPVTINNTSGLCTGTTTLTSPTVSDNCSGTPTNGLSLDGTNDYLTTPDIKSFFTGSSSMTVELWFNANAPGVIVDETGNGWSDTYIEILSGGVVKVRVWPLNAVTIGTVSFGTWHHVALRYNAATSTLDGLLDGIASGTTSTGVKQHASTMFLGMGRANFQNLGSGAYFNGKIDEVRIGMLPEPIVR
ncbi:hypothetical protein EMGBS15_18760 [Filimonas sp.]|nr:hypothetical protein EMGBS15_18760 [Filimonas sp.]